MLPVCRPQDALGATKVFALASVDGLTEWTDYIPVQETALDADEINQASATGFRQVNALADDSGLTAWTDYIPVYVVTGRADAWQCSPDGYIPVYAVTGSFAPPVVPATWDTTSFAASYTDAGPGTDTYELKIIFRTDGSIDVEKLVGSNQDNVVDPYVDPTAMTYHTWVRITYNSGDHFTDGDAEDVWHRLSTERQFIQRYTTGGGVDKLDGNFTLELSSDDAGVSIEATENFTTTVGELF